MPLPPPPPHQLPLPWSPSSPPPLPLLPLAPLPPRQVWTGLSPPHQARLRQVLIALLQEVAHVADAPGEDYAPPS